MFVSPDTAPYRQEEIVRDVVINATGRTGVFYTIYSTYRKLQLLAAALFSLSRTSNNGVDYKAAN